MLEKAHSQLLFSEKYDIDPFRNPYMTKLAIKIVPSSVVSSEKQSLQQKTQDDNNKILGQKSQPQSSNYIRFTSPFLSNNIFYVSQAFPIYRNQKFRLALLWRHNFKRNYAQSFLGFSAQYKIIQSWKTKIRMLFGKNSLVEFELHKRLNKKTDLMIYHSALFQDPLPKIDSVFHTLGMGITFQDLKVSIYKRMSFDMRINLNYHRKIYRNLFLQLRAQADIVNIKQSILTQFGISYYLLDQIKAYCLTSLSSAQKVSLKLQVEKKIEKNGNVLGNLEMKQGKTVFYIGYKSPSFQLSLPVLITDSLIPIGLAGLAFFFGYFLKKKIKIKQNKKSELQRQEQLRLISDKANQNYQHQKANGGLQIQEAYVGKPEVLRRLIAQENKSLALLRGNQYKANIYDSTICFRLYVQKGELNLPKGQKISLIGYFAPQNSQIYLKYKLNGVQMQRIYRDYEEIKIL